MNTRILVAVMICALAAPVAGSAQQRRRRTTPRRATPAAPAVDPSVEADRRIGASRVADQIKSLTRFIYLYGGVVKSVEAIDRNARESGTANAGQTADRNRASIRDSVHNVASGLSTLESDFNTKPALRPYAIYLAGVANAAAQAGQQADADQYDQAGRTLLAVIGKLADALAQMRQNPTAPQ